MIINLLRNKFYIEAKSRDETQTKSSTQTTLEIDMWHKLMLARNQNNFKNILSYLLQQR